jgi:hypothetical protein
MDRNIFSGLSEEVAQVRRETLEVWQRLGKYDHLFNAKRTPLVADF